MEEVYIIEDHIWEDKINIVFTDDINATIKHKAELGNFDPEKYLIDHADAVCLNIEEPNYNSSALVFDFNKIDLGKIVHETSHLTYNLLVCRGVNYNNETSEVFAYTQQWLFNKVHNFWLDFKNKTNE